MKTSTIVFCTLIAVFFALGGIAQASLVYTGWLSSDAADIPDGDLFVGSWSKVTLSWEVSQNADLTWRYKYTLAVDSAPDISHFIIEGSSNPGNEFTADNVLGDAIAVINRFTFTVDGPLDSGRAVEIQQHDTDPGNPGLPGSIYGIKIEDLGDFREITVEFDSDRVPVWGDFYMKGGPGSYAYNAGFTLADPTDPPASGSLQSHVLVPDSVVPEPTTLALLGLGGLAMLGKRMRIRRLIRR